MAKAAKSAKTAAKSAKSAKSDKPAKAATVTLRHIGNALAEAHEMPKKQANEVLVNMVDMITTHLKKGARIRIGGLGILQVRKRPAVSVVQCKHWQGKKVGVDKIRELRGVMAAHNVRRGQFATTSTFTEDALAFGRENSINLLDVSGLLGLIAQRTPEQQQALLAVALEGEYWRPTCVNCGTKLTERTPRGGGKAFWGCLNYPRCKTTMPMRSA